MKTVPRTLKCRKWWKSEPTFKVSKLMNGDLAHADALEFLESLKPECADIVFLDPPFNLGKTYARNNIRSDRLNDSDYFDFIKNIIESSTRVLKPGGALFLYHIPRWAVRFVPILQEKLIFRHWIAISMKNGLPRKNYLYPAHYSLLYFTKGQPKHFARPKIDLPRCPKCKELTKDYGGYFEFVKDGINLSDIWEDLSPVRHAKFKHRVANELCVEIPNRIVEISGAKSGLLVDPFAGSGSSLVAAQEAEMSFVACDKVRENIAVMKKRLIIASKQISKNKRG